MSTYLTILALFLGIFSPFAVSQQNYYTERITEDCTVYHPENAGYVCDASTSSCNTVAYFRVQSGDFASLDSIAKLLFNTTASAIASASGLSTANVSVSVGQGLYIPLTCTCYGNHSSQNVSYTIHAGDTFDIVANSTYEGLTTCQAIQDENPTLVVRGLQIGQKVIMPIRCACPSATQKSRGILSLVTYPVADGDDINSIVNKFGIMQQEFLTANNLSSASAPLFGATTVVLPFLVKPSNPPNATSSSSPPSTTSPSSSSSSSKMGIYIGISGAIVAALLLLGVLIFCCMRFKKKKGEVVPTSPPKHEPSFLPTKDTKMPRNLHEGLLEFASSEKLATFTLEEIKQATQDFSPATQIKGAVYRGIMKGRLVAVKNVRRNVLKELQILRKVHHVSLVTLLGSCIVLPEQSYLVYEYAENGSLSDCLHNGDLSTSSGTLGWANRLQVALDAATALEYIHDHANPSYVHKDVKSSNILLDSKYRGKLANFALARSATVELAVTRHIVGTQGYMAPEYLSQGVVSPKIDVFALGVVLLEILSGKEAVIRDEHNKEMFLSSAISKVLIGASPSDGKESLRAWMDPRLQNVYPLDCAYSVALLARSCVSDDPSARPHVRDVAYTLSKTLEISLEWEPSTVLENYSNNALEAR